MEYWSLKSKSILIVEDFPDMRSMLRGAMFSFGAREISEARNGQEAIEALARGPVDIVLCDYNLGKGKDGQQVLEEAKHRDLLPHSSVFIMITAENTSQMVMGAMEYLPDDYLAKPFTKTILQARIKKLVEKKESFRAINQALLQRDYDAGIELCDNYLASNSKHQLDFLKLKAELLLESGDAAGAAALYGQILATRDFPWAQLGLARAHFQQQEYVPAREILENLVASNPAFVMAYDWLARTLEKLADDAQAQKVLQEAVARSPRAILRQRALAQVSTRNADLATAEKAYSDVVKVGKHSCFKHPDDYTGLADVLCKTKTPDEALKVVRSMRQEFTGNNGALVQAAVRESGLCRELGREDESARAIAEAVTLFAAEPESVPSAAALQLARSCLEAGRVDDAKQLLRHVVRNNHDDEALLNDVRQLLAESGADDSEDLVSSTRQEVVEINNRGVKLTQDGKLEQAIELFARAAKAMPENITINLNAAQALIMHVQKQGKNARQLQVAMAYLDRVRAADAQNARYQKLAKVCRSLG